MPFIQDCVATNFTKGAMCDLVATVVLKYCQQIATTQATCNALPGCSFTASSGDCELNINTADSAFNAVDFFQGSYMRDIRRPLKQPAQRANSKTPPSHSAVFSVA
jgi:hypothetical protein